jgi:hypothetical protein
MLLWPRLGRKVSDELALLAANITRAGGMERWRRLVWRVRLITELESDTVSETDVAAIERDEFAPETVGLTLDEGKRLALVRESTAIRAFILVPRVISSGRRLLAYPNLSFD